VSATGSSNQQVLRAAFESAVDDEIMAYVASIEDDRHLIACDIRGSLAHVAMLEHTGVFAPAQAERMRAGLLQILEEGLELKFEHEDVHMNVEKRLEEIIGEDARLLHTARSRNDQVALDLRLYVRQQQQALRAALAKLNAALVAKAAEYADAVMPGYTHVQRAQPVLFAHVLMSFHAMFERDIERLNRPFVSPLGACALAGTAVPTDPKFTATQLGADDVFTNSIDAVADRDFAAEFLFACSLLAVHLSQFAENLVLWCSSEFDFVKLPDELTTGSSIMPQKKNPDCMELVRGKAGQTIGELVNLLTTLKGLPFGYNRDLQETKPPVIRTAQTVLASVNVCAIAAAKMTIKAEVMRAAASDELLFATDIAEMLVANGMPFRNAHSVVGQLVRRGVAFSQLPPQEWETLGLTVSSETFSPEHSVAGRNSHGGTSPEQVQLQIARAKAKHSSGE
jgi:argininosuccinate lyase